MPQRMKHNLHVLVVPSLYPTEVRPVEGIYVQDQVQMLCRAGIRVAVLYPEMRSWRTVTLCQRPWANRFQAKSYREAGVDALRIHGWNIPRLKRGTRVWLGWVMKLVKDYVESHGKPDLCHAHNCHWAGVSGRMIKKVYGIPYLITEHSTAFARGLLKPWQARDAHDALEGADAVLAVSEALKRDLQPYAPGKSLNTVSNVVDTAFFCPPSDRAPSSAFRFLSVAHLVKHKGIDDLIRAFAELRSQHPFFTLEIGGDGPEKPGLERLARELHPGDGIRFLGKLDRYGVRDAMWRADVFVLPSHVETFGVVLIEALATGLPVVATRSGGPEGFVNEDAGFLVETRNPRALAKALETAFRRYPDFDKCHLRRYAEERFGEPAILERVVEIYQQILR